MNHPDRKFSKGAMAAVASAILAACGGGSGGTSDTHSPQVLGATSGTFIQLPADTIQRTGTISFGHTHAQGYIDAGLSIGGVIAFADFREYNEPMSDAYIRSEYSLADIDTCTARVDSSDASQNVGQETDPDLLKFLLDSSSVSAGSALSISTPAGSWPDLLKTEEVDERFDYRFVSYDFETDTSSLGELPNGSTISIPGDEFPTFDNISIPSVERLADASLSNLAEDRVTEDTQVQWQRPMQSNSDSFTTITLDFYEVDFEKEVELDIYIHCIVADDGEFSFPDNVKQYLSKYKVNIEDIWLTRIGISNVVRGSSAVLVSNSSTIFFF